MKYAMKSKHRVRKLKQKTNCGSTRIESTPPTGRIISLRSMMMGFQFLTVVSAACVVLKMTQTHFTNACHTGSKILPRIASLNVLVYLFA
mmetsp:Transcript_15060/g.19782  ORF Transcript_15060/g.19782 Transcript_15060/m.19782 type:complete len:90 (+) Transcript_15060:313-582(+)